MIERIECRGKLVHACTVAGETRADDVFPGHPTAFGVPKGARIEGRLARDCIWRAYTGRGTND